MDLEEYEASEPEAKRRRLRKGTHSCWECKRRKVRCILASPTDSICLPCRRRGTRCVGQELPEEHSHPEDSTERLSRVEALLDQLVQRIDQSTARDGLQSLSGQGQRNAAAIPTPASGSQQSPSISLHESSPAGLNDPDLSSISAQGVFPASGNARVQQPRLTSRPSESRAHPVVLATAAEIGKFEEVSKSLLAAFPSQKDTAILLDACEGTALFCHRVNDQMRSQMSREKLEDASKLGERPASNSHPVLLAKYMLMFSSLLTNLPPHRHVPGLSENQRIIMERLADTAITLVTTNEKLLGTVESLECILLEGLYHMNCGNVRRGWLAHRRAMAAAQLIGISRPRCPPVRTIDPQTKVDPQLMWSHVVFMDRFLSLMLGLPQGHSDVSPEPDAALACGTPNDRLEHLYSVIAARILERNKLTAPERAMGLTLEIDKELRKAADSLPTDFWRPPDFTGLKDNSLEAFLEIMRVRDQVIHYTLLNQLHLPYLLCPNTGTEYSKMSCVYASREIMTRFITFRTFSSVSVCCRLADFLALVAGMTLILAHLESHRCKDGENFLLHHRLGDRATVELVLKNMELNSKLNEDMLSDKCACLLQYLLRIEADAARAKNGQGPDGYHEDERKVLHITVPYFGTLRIGRDGISFVDSLRPAPQSPQGLEGDITIGGIGSVHITDPTATGENIPSSANGGCEMPLNSHSQPQPQSLDEIPDSQLPSTIYTDDFMPQQELYPGIAAGMDDWVFQGVDFAFFDRIMMQGDIQAAYGNGAADLAGTGTGYDNL